jgi:hypothetical protein
MIVGARTPLTGGRGGVLGTLLGAARADLTFRLSSSGLFKVSIVIAAASIGS